MKDYVSDDLKQHNCGRETNVLWLYILQVLEVNLTYNFYYKSQPHLTWNSLISFTTDKHKLFHLQGKTKNVYNILVTDLEIHYKFIWFPPSGLVWKQGGKRRETRIDHEHRSTGHYINQIKRTGGNCGYQVIHRSSDTTLSPCEL